MLREKPVSEKTLQKYCGFLGAVQRTSHPFDSTDSLYDLAKLHHINPASGKAIVELGIVERLTPTTWKWKAGKKDVTTLAFEILNKLLFKHKKQIHVPIPDFAAIGEALSTVADRLALISIQNEKLIKTSKTGQIENADAGDLFRVEDQRLFIAGHVTSAVYQNRRYSCKHVFTPKVIYGAGGYSAATSSAICGICGYEPLGDELSMSDVNDHIIKITDDLMAKLLKREHQNSGRVVVVEPTPHEVIGKCCECEVDVYMDEPNCTIVDELFKIHAYYCKNHLPHIKKQ